MQNMILATWPILSAPLISHEGSSKNQWWYTNQGTVHSRQNKGSEPSGPDYIANPTSFQARTNQLIKPGWNGCRELGFDWNWVPTGLTLKRTYQPSRQGQSNVVLAVAPPPPPNRERSLSTRDLRHPISPLLKIKMTSEGGTGDTNAAAVHQRRMGNIFLGGFLSVRLK